MFAYPRVTCNSILLVALTTTVWVTPSIAVEPVRSTLTRTEAKSRGLTRTSVPRPNRSGAITPYDSENSGQTAAGPGIIFVNDDALGANNGTSWQDAYTNIQDAINDTNVGIIPVQLWVAQGIYPVATDPLESLVLVENVEVLGGFVGVENTLAERPINTAMNPSVLTGDVLGDDQPNFGNRIDNAFHVVVAFGVNNTAVLDGLEIRGGNARGAADDGNGGGLTVFGGNPTIRNCVLTGNQAQTFGGGIYVQSGMPSFENCTLFGNLANGGGGACFDASDIVVRGLHTQNNNASEGGGVLIRNMSFAFIEGLTSQANIAGNAGAGLSIDGGSIVIVSRAIFDGNDTGGNGGAIQVTGPSNLDIVNSSFTRNAAGFDGGAIHAFDSGLRMQNCLLSGNEAGGAGGAISLAGPDLMGEIVNATIVRNKAGFVGGVHKDPTGTPFAIHNAILWQNRDTLGSGLSAQVAEDVIFDFSIMQGLTAVGPIGLGNFESDPLFVDPDGINGIPGDLDDDLRLLFGSPAIDAGNNNTVLPDFADLNGNLDTVEPTPLDLGDTSRNVDDPETQDRGVPLAIASGGSVVDIGAYEYFPDCNLDGLDDNEFPPSECVDWVGLCAVPGTEDFWTCFDNWNVDGDFYPDADGSPGGIADVTVELPAGTNAYLNEDVALPALHLRDSEGTGGGATLRVTGRDSDPFSGDLSFVPPALLRIDGTLLVSANRTIGAPNSELAASQSADPMIVGPNGVYARDPDSVENGQRVSAAIFTNDLFIEPGACEPVPRTGGVIRLEESMSLRVSRELHLIGATPASCVTSGGINPPPELKIGDEGEASILGDMLMSGAAASEFSGNALILIGGDFINQSVTPELVDWTGGTVIMTGEEPEQVFEVAGVDVGASDTGFFNGTDTNYSMNRVEIVDGASVVFRNDFYNTVGDGACDEALYVDTLVLQDGSSIEMDDARVYYHTLLDEGGTITTTGCGQLLPVAWSPEPAPAGGSGTCFINSTSTGVPCSTNADCTLMFESGAALDIPDDGGIGFPVIDTIVITSSFTVEDVNVGVEIDHTWVGDLIVTLEHNGRVATIIDQAGIPPSPVGCNSNDYDIVLDDEGAGGSVETLCGVGDNDTTPTSPPNYTPVEALSEFDGMEAQGPWRLYVSDNAAGDVGKLIHWTLDLSDDGTRECLGGANDGTACTLDAECPGGQCVGPAGGTCSLNSRYLGITIPAAVAAADASSSSDLDSSAARSIAAAGTMRTIKLTAVDVPSAPYIESDVWWAGTPANIPNSPHPTIDGAPLGCGVAASMLPEGPYYLYGEAIVPGATYEVRLCNASGANCSTGLNVSTGKWADTVSGFGGDSQPNFADITALVDKFKGAVSAPFTPRTDLIPGMPDQVTNFADITAGVDAFKGSNYPFSAATCP